MHALYLILVYTFLIFQQLQLLITQFKAKLMFWRATSTLYSIQQHLPYLKKLPVHIGIILDSSDMSLHCVAELVSWCMGTGIHYITLYDIKGTPLHM